MTLSTPRILVSGETLIDFLPERPGPLSEVPTFERRPGGAPANVAVALSRLDETPWFWTRIARDPFGDFLAETLDAELPDRFVERDPDAKTTLAFVTHDEANDRAFTFYRDGTADTRLQPGGVPDDALRELDWVYVGGVMLASDPARTATFDLAERARAADCSVVFDPNARPELWPEDGFAEAVDEMLSLADVVKATPEDLDMAGFEADDADRLAASVCEAGPHTCLLTLGGEGAYAHATDDAPWESGAATHAGYDVSVVDTTGAGDAFTAGALAALADGKPLDSVLGFANAVAALTTTEPGAMTALPDRDAVRGLRESQSN
ncbi:PfkB domain protein [Haladaptatus paucihalophilus DX253]|uniref:Fructokinase n=1 Tax=Haladaptatus paucihalophilus DX253 TaxID=797209 RepID=E7QSN9_HALPU|nr:carbohydrate kinase [Haladaptatus paucihalophilus]EFW92448.1 PfkB domain protein [Haladaptatus paucihalophilus DX253]SHK06445.1 fructokinase [Haladaptatus paucihalophilus DX253]